MPRILASLLAVLLAAVPAMAQEPNPIRADEPFAREFSAELAARALDQSTLHWLRTRNCAACHTVPPYLMARPALAAVVAEPPEVRAFLEDAVAGRRETAPVPADGRTALAVATAAALAFHDARTTKRLHPQTRQALDRIWTLQRPDGSWEWPFRETPPIKADPHYGVTLAALAVGVAPERYSRTAVASKGLDGIRSYLQLHPPPSLHQRAMLVWASCYTEGLMAPAERERALTDLLAAQRPDGGWSMGRLVVEGQEPARLAGAAGALRAERGYGSEFLILAGRDKLYKTSLAADGYATGLAVYVARQAGLPARDPRLQQGVAWLKRNQRASGRWFTPSQAWHTQHLIANAGTAYAVMALDSCGEIHARGK